MPCTRHFQPCYKYLAPKVTVLQLQFPPNFLHLLQLGCKVLRSVCLSVCLFVCSNISKNHMLNYLFTLAVAVALCCSAIRYELAVLSSESKMTHVSSNLPRNGSSPADVFARWLHWRRSLPAPTASCSWFQFILFSPIIVVVVTVSKTRSFRNNKFDNTSNNTVRPAVR